MTAPHQYTWQRHSPGHWVLVPAGTGGNAIAIVSRRPQGEVPVNRAFPQPRYRAEVHAGRRAIWALVGSVPAGRKWAERMLAHHPGPGVLDASRSA